MFVNTIVNNRLEAVFTSAENIGFMEQLFDSLVQGLANSLDCKSQRLCATALQQLCELWLGDPTSGPTFEEFTLQHVSLLKRFVSRGSEHCGIG